MSAVLFDRDVGQQPIQADHPAGVSPRDGEAFAALKAHIDQLTDIHASTAVDWTSVVALANGILKQEGKDLAVGTWLAAGLLETAGLTGLGEGIRVLRDLVATYWEDMSPAVTRMRGRRNQIQWLLDHLNERLQAGRDSYPAMPAAAHAAMLEDWEALDSEWQRHDDEAPAFYGLRSALRNLPVEAPAQPEPVVDAAPQQAPAIAPAAAQAAVSRSAAPPPAASIAAPPAAGADPGAAADAALTGLRPLVDWYLQTQPTLPLLFRLNRVCAWATLEQTPPAQGGVTLLMPPPLQIVSSFEQIAQTGEPQAVVQFAESHLITHRYWLDLNRASHAALTRLGAADAAACVGFETGRLVARLPQLAGMKFNDGQPFADAQTLAWLESFTGAGEGASTTHDDADDLQSLSSAAEADAAAGRLDDALDRLQEAARRTEGLRKRFRLRLAQCALLHRFDDRADIRALMSPLIDELDAHRLQQWEPELARQALALAAAVELRYGAEDAGPSHPLLAKLASLDCRAAWQLSQSTAAA
ncbi:type VI secretion system protein TssA [Achromobacter sp. AGC78]|uniref:Type VI secretion system protein TssA n=1 Tax=Achromobacter spanius TaxID=217203 RepID=A0AA42LNQ2_9BURK|nr:type VI secretion system protein TssA [Achromobacter spanius]MDH0736665.1 type VI secretion system protein TssA [Achromobacter spanius]